MGTVFSFDLRHDSAQQADAALREAVASLHEADRIFSTYKPDSDISRLGRGEIELDQCDPLVREVLVLGEEAVDRGAGAFTLHPRGTLDPSAVVKGWAIERASDILRSGGVTTHLINGGGDVQACTDGPFAWSVAIVDPRDAKRVVLVVGSSGARRLAVATSGTAERGEHIVTRAPDQGAPLLSVSVVGDSLTAVDIAATTAFALGDDARAWIEAQPGLEAMAVTTGGAMWTTSGFSAYVVG